MTDLAPAQNAKPKERKKARLELYKPVAKGTSGFEYSKSPMSMVEFHFNPKELSTSVQADWSSKAKKGSVEPPEYTGCKPMTMSVELFLDGTTTGPDPVKDAISTLMSSVRPTSDAGKKSCPPLAGFFWGNAKSFACVVKSVSIQVTMFTPEGLPLRATCKLSLLEYAVPLPKTNPSSGAERSVKARRVGLGDTLASIANDELGDPSQWRAIATVNRIEDPFNLVVGSELLIPSPNDVLQLA